MIYPGYDIARQISGPPVLLDLIVDEDIPTGVVNYDFGWTATYEAIFIELTRCQSDGDGNRLQMEMSFDGGASFDVGATDYRHRNSSWSTVTATLGGATGLIGLSTDVGIGSAANETGSYSIIIPSPAKTGWHTAIAWGGHVTNSGGQRSDGTFGYRDASLGPLDAIRFRSAASALWTSGHARAVGLLQEGV